MSRRDDVVRLRDMLDAAQAAIRVLGDYTAEELAQTEVLALAVPHAPPHRARLLRRHYQRLWDTVHGDLPPLIEQLERLLKDVGEA